MLQDRFSNSKKRLHFHNGCNFMISISKVIQQFCTPKTIRFNYNNEVHQTTANNATKKYVTSVDATITYVAYL